MVTAENKTTQTSSAVTKNAHGKVPFFQAKLTINEPGDVYEQEADAMADKVMRMPMNDQPFFSPKPITVSHVQRKCAHCEEEEKKMQRKEMNNDTTVADASTENYISSLNGKGRSLTSTERKFFEPRMSYDFSDVQLHTNSEANQSAKSINALAYTHNNHIAFAAGKYQPNTDSGRRLIAHELTHVIQQGAGKQSSGIQRDAGTQSPGALDCGSPTLKCPPKTTLVNDSSNTTLGTLVHNMVQEKYLQSFQQGLGKENFILLDRGWGEICSSSGCTRTISQLAILDPPVHGAFSKPAKRGERGTGTLEQRPDILNDQLDEVAEIKSCTPQGAQEGRNDLVDYFSRLSFASEKMPPSGNRRKRNWHTSSWLPSTFENTQSGLAFQVVLSMPQPGLILYSIWSCRPTEDKEHDKPPIIIDKPHFDVKGGDRSDHDTKDKGDGKSNGDKDRPPVPGRPPRHQPEISTTTAAILAGIVALGALIATVFKPARIALLLGELLGMALKWLGFGLAIAGGATIAGADTLAGSPDGKPSDKPVPVPVPGDDTTPGKGHITDDASKHKDSPAKGVPAKPDKSKGQVAKIDLIEGVDLNGLSKGMILPILLTDLKSKHGVAILQVIDVVKNGNNTTVEFRSLQEQMGSAQGGQATRSLGGNKVYAVTHPYRGSDPPTLVGSLIKAGPDPKWFITYLDKLADELSATGEKSEADQVRKESQRIKLLVEKVSH